MLLSITIVAVSFCPVRSNQLSVSLSPLQETISPGQLVNIKATVSGGTGEYTYQWYSGSSSTCSEDTVFGSSMTTVSNSQDFAVYPNSTTSYCLEVQSPGAATIYSQMVTITVNSNSVTSNSLQNYVFLTNTGSSGAYTPMVFVNLTGNGPCFAQSSSCVLESSGTSFFMHNFPAVSCTRCSADRRRETLSPRHCL